MTLLSSYPVFQPLQMDLQATFQRFLSLDPPEISELTFSNLFSWQEWYHCEISGWKNPNLAIVRVNTQGNWDYFFPLGTGDKISVMRQVLQEQPGSRFIRVPASSLAGRKFDFFWHIVLDPDNSDYIYSAHDLTALQGRKYDGQRNHINRFRTAHDFKYIELTSEEARRCWEFEEFWCTAHACSDVPSLAHERAAIKIMLDHFSDLGLQGGALQINEEICALILAETLNSETLVVHILKGLQSRPGCVPALFQWFLQKHAADFKFINLEQDLGVPGLRQFKLSYHPIGQLEKYTISL